MYQGGEIILKLNKIILGASIIAMGLGVVGCGNMDNTTSRAPYNGNYPQQVRMDTANNTNMTSNGKYRANDRGRVVDYSKEGLANGSNYSGESGKAKKTSYNSKSDVARAERIQNALSRLNGYRNMTCVVNGDTAIVGCTPNEADNTQYKTDIINTVKKCDPSINRCEVVSDKDSVGRISGIAEKMRKGNMMSTVSDDFKKMWDDIVGY